MFERLSENALTQVLHLGLTQQLKLKPIQERRLPDPIAGHAYALYLHVPFCESLCPYCSFNRFLMNETQARRYFDLLRQEMEMTAALGYQFNTLYIGGGTPTVLPEELAKTIDLARALFDIREVSCETNPNHLTADKLAHLAGRVDRLSVGIQSFDDGLLAKMNRLETLGNGRQLMADIASAVGAVPVLNIDLIFNLPTQSEESLRRDLRMALESGANQITYYPLMAAPGTLHSMEKTMGVYSAGAEKAYYEIIYDMLSPHLPASSAWTFSEQSVSMIDEYIVDYGEHVGLGSGSFSYLDGTLYANSFSLSDYETMIHNKQAPLLGIHPYGRYQQMCYDFLMNFFGLEMARAKFEQRFGLPIELALPIEMSFMLVNGGFDTYNREKVTLSRRGRYLMIVMMREFFSGVNLLREQARGVLKACQQTSSPASVTLPVR
ncbi:MAG: coproporphyrinogen III oxidase family protein [Anaerolineae bacterium]|nr:coproporphyrinogen III oxidase family protein [Anaerolineae bacterium]